MVAEIWAHGIVDQQVALNVCTFHIALIVVPIIDGIASVGDAINDNSVMVTVKGMYVLYSANCRTD